MGALLDALVDSPKQATTPQPTVHQPGKLLKALESSQPAVVKQNSRPDVDIPIIQDDGAFMAGIYNYNELLDRTFGGVLTLAHQGNEAVARFGGNEEEAQKSNAEITKISDYVKKREM